MEMNGRFFLPGPTEVAAEVLAAQTQAMIGHRGAGIQVLMEKLQVGLKDLFRTERQVFVSSSSATGLMEAAARNGVKQKALSLVNGAFSSRFADIVESCGFEVERMEVPWGGVFDPQVLRDRLKKGGVDAVTLVHSETSTGALNPLEELASVIHEFDDVVILVDSVTGVGGAEMLTDTGASMVLWELSWPGATRTFCSGLCSRSRMGERFAATESWCINASLTRMLFRTSRRSGELSSTRATTSLGGRRRTAWFTQPLEETARRRLQGM